MMSGSKHIAQVIKNTRKQLSLTQETLAEMCGISVKTLRAIEKETSNAELKTLLSILTVLGLTIEIKPISITNEVL